MTAESGRMISHYRLAEKIGEGGMGVVWRAEDTVLGRRVAIKILPATASEDDDRRRMFLDEARLASSVSEAHIVQVYEFGREGDLDFIVMEYVEGRPLNRILHGRPLPPDKVAEIGLQVAQALARAHRKGLLHRDLKPANILITPEGDVKVVDFGLAALFPPADPATAAPTRALIGEAATGSSGAGRVSGTLPYMSPEQIRGERLDPRSDIFSLGTMLYEMTTGQRPFAATETFNLAAEIQSARFRPIPELVPSVPLDLNRIVQKALAARPADRYQTMEDLAVDLKRLGRDLEAGSSPSFEDLGKPEGRFRKSRLTLAMAAGIVVLVAAGIVVPLRWWGGKADSATILILPLKVRGQAEGADYVGQAFAEALAVHLAPSPGIHILPVPESPGAAAGSDFETRVARRAGAGRLVTGSLTRLGDRVQASLSLLDPVANRILWGAQKETDEENLTGLAASFAREVARELDANLPKRYDATWNLTGGPEMAADPLTAEALGALRRSEADAAAEATRRLVQKYPSEADAHVLRCSALHLRFGRGAASAGRISSAEVKEAVAALRRVDSSHPFIDVFQVGTQPLGDAIDAFTRVLGRDDLTPAARVEILQRRAFPKQHSGDLEGAIADLEEALRLDPANASLLSDLGVILRRTGHVQEAVARTRQAVALEPSNWLLYHNLSLALGIAQDHAQGLEASRKACDLNPNQQPCASFAIALLQSGKQEEAIAAARVAEAMPESVPGTYNLACFWSRAGDAEKALRFLRRFLDLGGASTWVAEDPDLEPLHGNPEFEKILAEQKLQIESSRDAGRVP